MDPANINASYTGLQGGVCEKTPVKPRPSKPGVVDLMSDSDDCVVAATAPAKRLKASLDLPPPAPPPTVDALLEETKGHEFVTPAENSKKQGGAEDAEKAVVRKRPAAFAKVEKNKTKSQDHEFDDAEENKEVTGETAAPRKKPAACAPAVKKKTNSGKKADDAEGLDMWMAKHAEAMKMLPQECLPQTCPKGDKSYTLIGEPVDGVAPRVQILFHKNAFFVMVSAKGNFPSPHVAFTKFGDIHETWAKVKETTGFRRQ